MSSKTASKKAASSTRPTSSKVKSKPDSKVKVKPPTDKETKLQEAIDGLRIEVLMLRCNLDPVKIEEEIQKANMVASEDLVSWLNKQIRMLEYQLKSHEQSSPASSTEGTKLQEKMDKMKKDNDSLVQQISKKEGIIKQLQENIEEVQTLSKTRGKDIEQNRKTEAKLKTENADLKQKLDKTETELSKHKSRLPQVLAESASSSTKKTIQQLEEKCEKYENKIKLQDNEIAKSAEKVTEQCAEIDKLKKDLNTLQETFDRSEQGTEATGQILEEKGRKIDELNEENKNVKAKMEQKENELSNLREEMDIKEHALQELKKSTASSNGKDNGAETSDILEKKMDEISRLNTQLKDAKRKCLDVSEELSKKDMQIKQMEEDHKKKIDMKDEKCRDASEKLSQKEKQIKQMEDDHKKQIDMKDEKCRDASEKLSQKEKQIKQIEEDHKKEISKKDEAIQKMQKEKSTGDKMGSGNANLETKSLVEKYEKTETELKSAKDEIDELKNRLSKVVGANIMNDNPNITDLSDENRPTKLSEKFSELYDNEWTDAFEETEDELKSEEKSIAYLYKTLQDIFDFCKSISEDHAKNIKSCVLTVPNSANGRPESAKIGVTNLRQLKELRKSFAPYLVESVFQHFVKTKKIKLAQKKNTEKFMKKCVEICWLMNSQDPPVILDKSNEKGKGFDGDKFRTYTKTGKLVDYVVWPPMRLHEDGPLLCKGVAQGK